MTVEVKVMHLIEELKKNKDEASKRAIEEIQRLYDVIARNCDASKAATDGDRWIIEFAQLKIPKP